MTNLAKIYKFLKIPSQDEEEGTNEDEEKENEEEEEAENEEDKEDVEDEEKKEILMIQKVVRFHITDVLASSMTKRGDVLSKVADILIHILLMFFKFCCGTIDWLCFVLNTIENLLITVGLYFSFITQTMLFKIYNLSNVVIG